MIREALEYLSQHLLEQKAPQSVAIREPEDRNTFILPDGSTVTVEAPPKPREIVTYTVASFAEACVNHKVDRVDFLNAGVQGVIDPAGRERVYMPLTQTSELNDLLDLLAQSGSQDAGISPRELTFKLRSDLRNCFTDDGQRETLINKFGQLKTVTLESGERQHSRTQDTMGESINRQISDDLDLPDEIITFHPRMYLCPDLVNVKMPIKVYCQPNLERKMWVLRLLDDSYQDAAHNARVVLQDKIKAAIGDEIAVNL